MDLTVPRTPRAAILAVVLAARAARAGHERRVVGALVAAPAAVADALVVAGRVGALVVALRKTKKKTIQVSEGDK